MLIPATHSFSTTTRMDLHLPYSPYKTTLKPTKISQFSITIFFQDQEIVPEEPQFESWNSALGTLDQERKPLKHPPNRNGINGIHTGWR